MCVQDIGGLLENGRTKLAETKRDEYRMRFSVVAGASRLVGTVAKAQSRRLTNKC